LTYTIPTSYWQPGAKGYKVVSGAELQQKLRGDIGEIREYREEAKPQLAQLWKHYQETKDWHPGTTVALTPAGGVKVEETAHELVPSSLFQMPLGIGMNIMRMAGYKPPTITTRKERVTTHPEYEALFPFVGAEKYYSSIEQFKKTPTIPVQILPGVSVPLHTGSFVTTFTKEDPLGLVSAYYTATGEKQKALETKAKAWGNLKSMYGPKGEMTWGGFGRFWLESPITQIGLAYGIGVGVGAGSTYAASAIGAKYGAGSAAMWGFRGTQAAVGGVFIGLAAADVKQTLDVLGPGEAFGKAGLYGFQFAGAMAGYVAGSRGFIRGATPGEWGARHGYISKINKLVKTGKISPEYGGLLKEQAALEFGLRRGLRGIRPFQPEPDFSKIQTLERQPGLRRFFESHLLRRKAGIFGSAAEDRMAHDIDIMYRNLSQGLRESQYASGKFKAGGVEQYADIKAWQRVGSQVGRLGTVKQPWYMTVKGYRLMRISESALRHGESGLELAHAGRVKDVPRAVDLYTKLFKAAGSPKELQYTLTRYADVMAMIEKQPFVMSKMESQFLYGGKSFGEMWAGFKTKVYTKIAPASWAEKSFLKTMGMDIPTVRAVKPVSTTGLPPSPSSSAILFGSYPSSVFATGSAMLSSLLGYSKSQAVKYNILSSRFHKSYSSASRSLTRSVSGAYPSISISKPSSKVSYPSTSSILGKTPSTPTPSTPSKSYLKSLSSILPSPSRSSVSKSGYYSSPYSSFFAMSSFILPSRLLYGRGRERPDRDIWGLRYRYRKFKIRDPFAIDKQLMKSIMR